MVRVSVLKDYCLKSMNLLAQPHEDFRGVSCVLPTVSFPSFLNSLLKQKKKCLILHCIICSWSLITDYNYVGTIVRKWSF